MVGFLYFDTLLFMCPDELRLFKLICKSLKNNASDKWSIVSIDAMCWTKVTTDTEVMSRCL